MCSVGHFQWLPSLPTYYSSSCFAVTSAVPAEGPNKGSPSSFPPAKLCTAPSAKLQARWPLWQQGRKKRCWQSTELNLAPFSSPGSPYWLKGKQDAHKDIPHQASGQAYNGSSSILCWLSLHPASSGIWFQCAGLGLCFVLAGSEPVIPSASSILQGNWLFPEPARLTHLPEPSSHCSSPPAGLGMLLPPV